MQSGGIQMNDARTGNTTALVLATLGFTVCFAVWGLISALAPIFRQLWGLSATQSGLLVATPVVLGSVVRVPLGMLTDRYGGRIVFTVLLLIVTVPTLLAGFAGSYSALLAVSLFIGLAGASFAVGVPFVSRWYPTARQGFALGIYGIGNAGSAVATFTAPRVAAAYGWPVAFWLYLPLLVLMAIVYWLVGRDAPSGSVTVGSLGERLAVFRRQPVSLVLALFYFVTFGGFVAMSVYLPTLLVGEYGLTATDAGARTAGFVAVATLARPIGGYLADRWSGTQILNGVFAVVAIFAIALAFRPDIYGITVAFLGCAFALGLGNGTVFKLVAGYFPKETGTVTGLVGAAGGLGGFFPPLVMGAVRDLTGSYAIGFMLLSEFAMLALIVNLLALQRYAGRLAPGD